MSDDDNEPITRERLDALPDTKRDAHDSVWVPLDKENDVFIVVGSYPGDRWIIRYLSRNSFVRFHKQFRTMGEIRKLIEALT